MIEDPTRVGSSLLIDPIVMSLIEAPSLIDVGCGDGKFGFLTRIYKVNMRFMIGCDIFLPSLVFCKQHKLYNEVVLCDAGFLPFKENSCATVIMIEIIEHLEETKGKRMINGAEKIAQKKIIVTTPNKARKRLGHGINPYQAHISSWTVQDLRRLGFKVYGVGSRLAKVPSLPAGKINVFFAYTFLLFPRLAIWLIAWKKIRKC
ncbi:MAG: methyltransferase domain-containing protein [Promethearchaeota archaeon]